MKKKRRGFSASCRVLVMGLLVAIPVFIIFFSICSMNSPSHLGVYFPEGTQIIEQTDTHRGLFRKKGTAIVVAKIPQEYIQSFDQQLQEEGFIEFPPLDHVQELLASVEAAAPILEAEHVLWTYRDESVAFVEEPFSDYFAAIYDRDTGGCCWVEYDS